MRKFLRSTLLRAPKMAVEVVPEASEKIIPRRQDPTTQRRRARYPPPTPPQAQVACPVSKEAGRQAGRKLAGKLAGIFGGAGGVSQQRQQPTRRRQPGGHLPSIWNPARVSPAAARCDDDSARAVSRPPPPSCRPRAGDDDS